MAAKFDDTRFLAAFFSGHEEMCNLIQSYGFEPPLPDTASKWFRRGAIPGAWFPILLGVLEMDNGGPISVAPFIVR
jgi:hypothetical protein